MKILYLRSDHVKSDSRLEKELYSLSKEHTVEFLGWDRQRTYKGTTEKMINIIDRPVKYRHFGIKANSGQGIKRMALPLLRYWLAEYKYLKRHLNEYDAVHACDLDTALPLLLIKKARPIIYDIYDYYADTHAAPILIDKTLRRLEIRMICKSDAVIICSEARRQQILPARPDNLVVIHNSPPCGFTSEKTFALQKQDEKSRYKIIYAGVFSADRFLKEIVEVIAARSDVELHIGGRGLLETYICEQAKQYPNILFYGQVNYQDVLSLEQQCDIMTAIYDPRTKNHKYTAPNKFYEALMLKKPLIIIENTGMDGYVAQYDLGKVIPGSAETFKENFNHALDELIARRDEWKAMGERGYKLYQEQFSWDEMERRLLKLYRSLFPEENEKTSSRTV